MKRLGKLAKKSICEMLIMLAVVLAILLLCIFLLRNDEPDYFAVRVVLYLMLFLLAIVTIAIYTAIVVCSYSSAQKKLRLIRGFLDARFEREIVRSPQFNNLLISSDAICYLDTAVIRVIPLADIVWAYQEQDKNVVRIYTRDKQKYLISVFLKKKKGKENEKAVRYLLRLIVRKNKGALVGYKDVYEDLYKHDFERMLMQTHGGEIVDSALLEQEYIANDYYHLDFQ